MNKLAAEIKVGCPSLFKYSIFKSFFVPCNTFIGTRRFQYPFDKKFISCIIILKMIKWR